MVSLFNLLSLLVGAGTAQVCPNNKAPFGMDSGRVTRSLEPSSTFYFSSTFNGPMRTDRPPEFIAIAGDFAEFATIDNGCWTKAYHGDSWQGILRLPPRVPSGPIKLQIRAWGKFGGLVLNGDDQDGPLAYEDIFVQDSVPSSMSHQLPIQSPLTSHSSPANVPNASFEMWQSSRPELHRPGMVSSILSVPHDSSFIAFAGGQFSSANNLEVLSHTGIRVSTPLWLADIPSRCYSPEVRGYFVGRGDIPAVEAVLLNSTAGWIAAGKAVGSPVLQENCIGPEEKILVRLSTSPIDVGLMDNYSDYPESTPVTLGERPRNFDPLGPVVHLDSSWQGIRNLVLVRGTLSASCDNPWLSSPAYDVVQFREWEICRLVIQPTEVLPRQAEFEALMRSLRSEVPARLRTLMANHQDIPIPERFFDNLLEPAWIRWSGVVGSAIWDRGEVSLGRHWRMRFSLIVGLDLDKSSVISLRLVGSKYCIGRMNECHGR